MTVNTGGCFDSLKVSYGDDMGEFLIEKPVTVISPEGYIALTLSTCYRLSPVLPDQLQLEVKYKEVGRSMFLDN